MWLKRAVLLLLLLLLSRPAWMWAVGVEESAPSFELKAMDGQTVNYEKIRGKKPLFLVFWATWCPVCKEEIPKLKSMYSRLKPEGFEFLAVDVGVNDSVKKVRRYIEKNGIEYPVAFDEDSSVTRLFDIKGTPTVVIVDRGGTIRYRSSAIPDDLTEHLDMLNK